MGFPVKSMCYTERKWDERVEDKKWVFRKSQASEIGDAAWESSEKTEGCMPQEKWQQTNEIQMLLLKQNVKFLFPT